MSAQTAMNAGGRPGIGLASQNRRAYVTALIESGRGGAPTDFIRRAVS
jgi:hypothetical protein